MGVVPVCPLFPNEGYVSACIDDDNSTSVSTISSIIIWFPGADPGNLHWWGCGTGGARVLKFVGATPPSMCM